MTDARPPGGDPTTFEQLIPAVTAHLSRNASFHYELPEAGMLLVDRPLPFLCVYRSPADREDAGTAEFVTAEAAFLIAPGADEYHDDVAKLSQAIGDTLYNRFGGFLFLEVWSRAFAEAPRGPHLGRPAFRVVAEASQAPVSAVETLREALASVTLDRQRADVEVVRRASPAPPGMRALYRPADAERQTCRHIGLEIDTVYRQDPAGPVYPLVLASLRSQVAHALRRALFDYSRRQHEKATPEHYQALGPRGLIDALRTADRRLQEIGGSFDFILLSTPTNADAAWAQFKDDRFTREPPLLYRPLSFHPDLVKRRLYDIRLEEIKDPTLQHLMREKRDALDLQISMLAARGTRDFLYGSLRQFGGVEDDLLALARDVLDRTRERTPPGPAPHVEAAEFRRRAREAIRRYHAEDPAFTPKVRRRNDIAAGVMVSKGDLLVSDSLSVLDARVDPLIHHEVGTHLLTYYNAIDQPFLQLREGLAGFEPLQEGLAVLAEYVSGGLTRARLRQLAARVVAVRTLVDGASFCQTFEVLRGVHGLGARRAFTTTLRVHRSGGLTKDAAYLRGLSELLAYLSGDGELEPLFVGKIALRHVPLVLELSRRDILRPPRLWPHYLRDATARARLEACRGRSVIDLCAEAS
jgi:uncharacterized protein (TIGR02421 family)